MSLLTGLTGCWDFDETSGSTAYDSAGNYNGTLYNTPTIQEVGVLDYSYYFVASSSEYVGFSQNLITSFPFTVSFWFNFNGTACNPFSSSVKSTAYTGFCATIRTTSLEINFGNNTANGSTARRTHYFLTTVPTNEWCHVVFMASGINSVSCYFNGTEISLDHSDGSASTVVWSGTGITGSRVSGSWGGGFNYTGYIDQLAIWSSVLSSTDIENLYNYGNGLAYNSWEVSSISSSLSSSLSSSPSSSSSSSPSSSVSPSSSSSSSPSPGYENYTKGEYLTLPAGNDSLTTTYSTQEYTDVNTKNDVRVDQTSLVGGKKIHQFKDYVGIVNNCSLEWEGQSTIAPSSRTVYLQIYGSSGWDTVDSESVASANTDFILSGTIADLSGYKDPSSSITCRVYQDSIPPTYGYFAGGTVVVDTTYTERIVFSTEVVSANTASYLSSARNGSSGLSDGLTYGYFAGGGNLTTTDRIIFSTSVTSANTVSNLSLGRKNLAGLSDYVTYGYFAGGYSGGSSAVNTADRITFSSGATSANTASNLSQARTGVAGLSDGKTYGYFAGGSTMGSYPVTRTDRIVFSSGVTSANTVSNISQAERLACVSDGINYGYFAGGHDGYTEVVTTSRIVFSTGVTSANTVSDLSTGRYLLAGLSNNSNYGYFSGGIDNIDKTALTDRIVFSSGVTSACTTSNLSSGREGLVGLSDYIV